jgi:hypothetical protein
VRFQSLVELSR